MFARLSSSASVATMVAALIWSGQANAQTAAEKKSNEQSGRIELPQTSSQEESDEEIVVTGSNIRGTAPVGSNLIAVTADDISTTGGQNISEALSTIPQLSGMGGEINDNQPNYYQPSIHGIGGGANNSTLVLVDGHRAPVGGYGLIFMDPNIIPLGMIGRVEILTDGASATYGSDAVSGVVNFITRKRMNGVQTRVQTLMRDGSFSYSAGIASGKSWDDGSAIVAYSYSKSDNLRHRERPYTYPDQRPNGGSNFTNSWCSPATIQPNSTGQLYDLITGAVYAHTGLSARCSNWEYTDLMPLSVRNNIMAKVTQELTPNLEVGLDLVYGHRRNQTGIGAGTITSTAFQTGIQANPFYINPVGRATTRQAVRWNATELFGPGTTRTGADSMYASFTATYRFLPKWNLDFLAFIGKDNSFRTNEGTVNWSVFNLALNGTTNPSGDRTLPSIVGTNQIILAGPLTPETAVDVWNPAATNRTSQAVREMLLDNDNWFRGWSTSYQVRAIASGELLELPAGPLQLALGAEAYGIDLHQMSIGANGSGPASQGAQAFNFYFDRKVWSVFAEANVPVLRDKPFARKVDLGLAFRYDDYSDFGSTSNPRVGVNWEVVKGVRLRGNYSTSFVAPPLTLVGPNGNYASAGYGTTTTNARAPFSGYPILRQMGIPGCDPNGLGCVLGSLEGIQVVAGDPDAQPQRGRGWGIGVDFVPEFLPGFSSQVMFWSNQFTGAFESPDINNVINLSSAQHLLTFYPNCASPEQVHAATAGLRQLTGVPACIDFIFMKKSTNYLNLKADGIDYSFDYHHRLGNGTLSLGVSGTEFLSYQQSFGSGEYFSIMNTTGLNVGFPSVRRQMRLKAGWEAGAFSTQVYMNYTGPYRSWYALSVAPISKDENGNPNGGGDRVAPNYVFNLNMKYRMRAGPINRILWSLTVNNIFDRRPPFYNTTSGYDRRVANTLGRTASLTATLEF